MLSARRVGPSGRAIGLDMTDDMLTLARRHAEQAVVTNVEFLKGAIEQIPLPDASVDVVISNCLIALSSDKPAVFGEIACVLRPRRPPRHHRHPRRRHPHRRRARGPRRCGRVPRRCAHRWPLPGPPARRRTQRRRRPAHP
ncbi:methyltransferase domain-containing protein [Amycolatopsis sp. NPDC004625]|uniref:methyltransferase domain-containing protein n=1 Tax=Amycolatopsis sp. NPDC004625 TaxID=3154670 RepID=UPI0033A84885